MRTWLVGCLDGGRTIALAWTVLLGFLRVATGPYAARLGVDEATDLMTAWLQHPATTLLEPTPAHPSVLRHLLRTTGTSGSGVMDAHIAALALEHGASLATLDRDFLRFRDLKVVIPGE